VTTFSVSDAPKGSLSIATWLAFVALAVSLGTTIFTAGIIYGDVKENTRVNQMQDSKLDGLIPRVERIDANVEFLAEQAREDRARRRD
jgi:hypothetical protein